MEVGGRMLRDSSNLQFLTSNFQFSIPNEQPRRAHGTDWRAVERREWIESIDPHDRDVPLDDARVRRQIGAPCGLHRPARLFGIVAIFAGRVAARGVGQFDFVPLIFAQAVRRHQQPLQQNICVRAGVHRRIRRREQLRHRIITRWQGRCRGDSGRCRLRAARRVLR